MESDTKITDAAAIFATALGTFKVLGSLSGIWIFSYLGQTFGISPSPNPFTQVSHPDPSAVNAGIPFGCGDGTGQIEWHRWNYLVRGAVPGPHRRIVSLLSYFGSLRRLTAGGADPRAESLTRYYFCNNGPLAQAAGCSDHISAVYFNYNNPSAEKPGYKSVSCTN